MTEMQEQMIGNGEAGGRVKIDCSICPNRAECKSMVAGALVAHKTEKVLTVNNFCVAECNAGFLCGMPKNHSGNEHEAFIKDGIVARWKN